MKLWKNALNWLTRKVTLFSPWARMDYVYLELTYNTNITWAVLTERSVKRGLAWETVCSFIRWVSTLHVFLSLNFFVSIQMQLNKLNLLNKDDTLVCWPSNVLEGWMLPTHKVFLHSFEEGFYHHMPFSVAERIPLRHIIARLKKSVAMVKRYEVLRSMWSSHFWIKMHAFHLFQWKIYKSKRHKVSTYVIFYIFW